MKNVLRSMLLAVGCLLLTGGVFATSYNVGSWNDFQSRYGSASSGDTLNLTADIAFASPGLN
ncbi:MAG: hypothetical protein LBN20_00595, partial [Endomicrobium sp.]|nr:hypothetical protein [Endomicrobium sp.]